MQSKVEQAIKTRNGETKRNSEMNPEAIPKV